MGVYTYPKDGAWTVRVDTDYGYWEYYTTIGFYEARLLCGDVSSSVRSRRFSPNKSIDWNYYNKEE